jgi:cell division initiation protein
MTTRKPLSPIEIQSTEFRRVLRGFDPEEVQLFLHAVAESYQALTLENQKLAKDVEHLQASMEDFHRRENLLREALYTAQKVADDVKAQAMREAQSIVQEAEVKGQSLMNKAQLRSHEIERSIMDLRMEREEAQRALADVSRRIESMLEAMKEQARRDNVASFGKDAP